MRTEARKTTTRCLKGDILPPCKFCRYAIGPSTYFLLPSLNPQRNETRPRRLTENYYYFVGRFLDYCWTEVKQNRYFQRKFARKAEKRRAAPVSLFDNQGVADVFASRETLVGQSEFSGTRIKFWTSHGSALAQWFP